MTTALASNAAPEQAWSWPAYRKRLNLDGVGGPSPRPKGFVLSGLASAAFIEWRYYAVLSDAFHGFVGLALVNPDHRFATLAEGGLLLLVAGVLDRPAFASSTAASAALDGPAELCWMHLFSTADCRFDHPGPGGLQAGDSRCCVELRQSSPSEAELRVDAGLGLGLSLRQQGLPGSAIPAEDDVRLDGLLGRLIGSQWCVQCPAPVAFCDGELTLTSRFLNDLPASPGVGDSFASSALRERIAGGQSSFCWQGASGYYEHSFGVRPLPLHGWDFLFVPDAVGRRSLVMQTYRGSDRLNYVDCCWVDRGQWRRDRLAVDASQLRWAETCYDPVLGVVRPTRRVIETEADGLCLRVDNRILHRVPLLRPWRAAVRHFFISEEIGIADWRLTDAHGRVLVEARAQPCGGELAHRRLRTPRAKDARPAPVA
jgi:hypothetical protein